MRIGKKFLIYLFCGLLTFSVVSSSYYKTAYAFEYVGGALAFDAALKWLLACIGITAGAGMTDAYWDAYGDEFTDYAIQNGATQTEVAEWQVKACEGILDKGSEVWDRFLEWANNLVSSGSSSDNIYNSSYIIDYINANYNTSLTNNVSFDANAFLVGYYGNTVSTVKLFGDGANYRFESYSGSQFKIQSDTTFNYASSSSGSGTFNNYVPYQSYASLQYSSFTRVDCFNITHDNFSSGFSINDISLSGNENTDFNSLDGVNTNDLDVISSDGVNEADDEVTLPYPGVSDSDNTLSNDAYQDIVDKINDGTITQEQGIEQIQELLRVITYDTVTDEVVPPQKNDDGTNKTKDDALKDNKDNAGFTLAGLENVFPFCIPFDIYAFMTLLVAEPVTPEFDFPIKTVNGQQETIHVDLEPFEPVAVVVRYVFDFLFIVGLAMLTRSLIGGGSSD